MFPSLPPKLKAVLTRIPRINNEYNRKTVDDFSKFLLDDSSIGDKHRARSLNTIIEFVRNSIYMFEKNWDLSPQLTL